MAIDRLTADQEARLPEFAHEWQGIGLATGQADRLRAERGIRRAYVAVGLLPPSVCIWARSPLEAVLGAAHLGVEGGGRLANALEDTYLELTGHPASGLWGRLWAPFVAPAHDPLRGFLARSLGFDPRGIAGQVDGAWEAARRAVRPMITPGLAAQMRIDLGAPVRRQVVDRFWAPVCAQIQDEVWSRLKAHLEAGHARRWAWFRTWTVVADLYRLLRVQDALLAPTHRRTTGDRLAMADFLDRVCGLDVADGLQGLMEIARAAGCWWPHRNGVVLCERPTHLRFDPQGRLHNETGPAVQYPDGWAIWAWHGVRVARQVIEQPEILSVPDVLDEPDVEVRRVMIERVGNESFLRDAGAERIAEDELGVLWRLDLADDEPLVCVQVTNSTAAADGTFRRYVLRVPPTVRSPREAVAWTFGVEAGEYRPTAET